MLDVLWCSFFLVISQGAVLFGEYFGWFSLSLFKWVTVANQGCSIIFNASLIYRLFQV